MGRKTYEYWEHSPEGIYQGIGYTLEKQDTVFKETLELTQIDNNWQLKITGVNESPTYFKLIKQSATGFTCENPVNEFPTRLSVIEITE